MLLYNNTIGEEVYNFHSNCPSIYAFLLALKYIQTYLIQVFNGEISLIWVGVVYNEDRIRRGL